MKKRLPYIIGFAVLLIIEILIALFIHGGFIRFYIGDVIVVWVVYCFVQIFICEKANAYITALGVMIFAFIVEFLQYINIVDIIGLGDIQFFRTLIGTSFSVVDLMCYACGTAVMCIFIFIKNKIPKKIQGN